MQKLSYTVTKVISLQDWDLLVQEVYERPYRFQQQDGCKERQRVPITIPNFDEDYENDTVPEVVNHRDMGVSFKAWLERDPSKQIQGQKYDYELLLWWERNFYPDVQMIANDLHAKGFIEAGDYTIDIDW
jgi:hypothetical protein